jgi:hypothetical protein
MVHLIPPASGKLTRTHVHALNKGAVVTQTLNLTQQEYRSIRYKAGDIIELETEDETIHKFRCRILDIESIKVVSEPQVNLRITLERATDE